MKFSLAQFRENRQAQAEEVEEFEAAIQLELDKLCCSTGNYMLKLGTELEARVSVRVVFDHAFSLQVAEHVAKKYFDEGWSFVSIKPSDSLEYECIVILGDRYRTKK